MNNKKILMMVVVGLLMLSGCGEKDNAKQEISESQEVTKNTEVAAMESESVVQESETGAIMPEDTENSKMPDEEVSNSETIGAENVSYERVYEEADRFLEYGIVKGMDSNNNVVWEYKTQGYEPTELDRTTGLGVYEDRYYLVEGGTIVCLNKADGSLLWKNEEFVGSGEGFLFGEDGTLYISGYYGPHLFIVDKNGNTITRIDEFDAEYYWPVEMELKDDVVEITMTGTPSEEPAKMEVNLQDYSYKIKGEESN